MPGSRSDTGLPVVLVVDDQEANMRLVGQLLSRAGYDIVPAFSGEQALERIKASLPDLILLDMRMPGMSGFDVLKQLTDNPGTRSIPVIFLTADNERDNVARALAAGAVDYITKPFVAEELLGRVKTHIDLKQSRDTLQRFVSEKQQMVETVAHDLRNYFANIQFAGDMLRDPDLDLAVRLRLIESIRTSSDSGVLFLQALLDHQNAQEKGISVHRLSARKLLDETAAALARMAHAKDIEVKILLAEDFEICGHQGGVLHVLQNLLSNALKFSQPGSEVILSAAKFGSRGRLSVSDRGPGVSKQDQERLFQRYVRLSATPTQGESSTGLGLALAKQRARTMDGDIWHDDREGGGSVFTLDLALPRT
ncbi:MAG TPA: hybrid sensor histidine kinase/response regulator [Arenimonas sp.]|mgnify:FL=1|nr:hybrid sensor histidine kinase/response regulator [Arenimonas sp.]